MLYELITPIKFDGSEVKEVNLNLEDLCGRDVRKAAKQFKMLNKAFVGVVEFEEDFLCLIAANASGKPLEFFDSIKSYDFCNILREVQSFLMGPRATLSETSV